MLAIALVLSFSDVAPATYDLTTATLPAVLSQKITLGNYKGKLTVFGHSKSPAPKPTKALDMSM